MTIFARKRKKAWSQSGLCDHVEWVDGFEDNPLDLHPNPNRNPA